MDKEWHKEYSKNWYERNKEHARKIRLEWQRNNKEKQRSYSIKQSHGITAEQYDAALEKQGSICAICQDKLIVGKNCHLDHCHATGKFRGFLCGPCNKGLGSFRDSQENLKRAVNYLETSELIFQSNV